MLVVISALAAGLAGGCGGQTHAGHEELSATMRRQILGYGDISRAAWESVYVRAVRVGPVEAPERGTNAEVDLPVDATLLITAASGHVSPGAQRVLPTHGITIRERLTVTADLSRTSGGVWTLGEISDIELPPPARTVDPAAQREAVHALALLFSYNGSRTVYRDAQLAAYATTPHASGVLVAPPSDPKAAAESLAGAPCPLGPFVQAGKIPPPSSMRPVALRVTRIHGLTSVPPTVEVDGKATIAAGWADGRVVARSPACRQLTSTVSFTAVIVRSLTLKAWLVGQLDIASSFRNVQESDPLYHGLDSW